MVSVLITDKYKIVLPSNDLLMDSLEYIHARLLMEHCLSTGKVVPIGSLREEYINLIKALEKKFIDLLITLEKKNKHRILTTSYTIYSSNFLKARYKPVDIKVELKSYKSFIQQYESLLKGRFIKIEGFDGHSTKLFSAYLLEGEGVLFNLFDNLIKLRKSIRKKESS